MIFRTINRKKNIIFKKKKKWKINQKNQIEKKYPNQFYYFYNLMT